MQAGSPEPRDPRQLHLGLFAPHEIRVWEEQRRGKALRQAQRSARAPRRFWIEDDRFTRSLFDKIDLALLERPLAGPQEGNELNGHVDALREDGLSTERSTTPEPEPASWSDQAVAQLHEAVLHYSLKALQARGNAAEKCEVLQWIFAPQPMVAVLRDAHGASVEVVLPQSATPFSFEQCCRICGYSPERLMDALMPVLKEVGLGSVFNEIANGTNPNPNPNQYQSCARDAALQDPRHVQPA